MIERRFYPLVNNLQGIQDPRHLIQEEVDQGWRRGGNDSREMLRNPKVLSSMGYIYNGKYWQKKK